MKTAQPLSLPPGDRLSAGIKRSTIASTVAASPGVKKYQPSGLTGFGGSPAKGDQGIMPDRLAPSAVAARIGTAATDASSRRRLNRRASNIVFPRPEILSVGDSVLIVGDPMR